MHFLRSRGCVGSPFWSPNHARRTSVADKWAGSLLVVSGWPSSPSGDQPTMLGTPCMIPGMGLKWSLPHIALVSPAV
jgi:hypothetical protein